MPATGISLPRELDLRSLQQSFSQIATRLGALEKALGVTTAQVGQTSVNAGQSNASIANLNDRLSRLESTRFTAAAETTLRADGTIALFDVVYASSPEGCSTADPAAVGTAIGILGVAENAATTNSSVTVRRFGALTIPAAGFTPDRPVYWGPSGLTHAPSSPLAIPVGVAVSSNTLFVLPGDTLAAETPTELLLPVAYALVQVAVELVDGLLVQPDGIVVKDGDMLITRAIHSSSGSGLDVLNGNGVAGDIEVRLS